MEKKPVSRVLIIGLTFNKRLGGGVTISSLFSSWDSDKIAVISEYLENSSTDICNKYYQLGPEENNTSFLLSIFQTKMSSGKSIPKVISDPDVYKKDDAGKSFIVKLFNQIFIKVKKVISHYYYLFTRYRLSDKLIQWIKNFSPDLIYIVPYNIKYIRFALEISEKLDVPIVTHFMDDFEKKSIKDIFYFYSEKMIKKEISQLIKNSKVLLSICQAMSDDYKLRFKKEFLPFHNPVDLKEWLPFTKDNWAINDNFTIAFTGTIAVNNFTAIVELSKAIDICSKKGLNIILKIYSPHSNSDKLFLLLKKKTKMFSSVRFENFISHNEMPKTLSDADLLFLPLSFDKKSIFYTRLSMPTKTAEYMISGTPVLVYAPKEIALSKFVLKEEWAFVLNDRGVDELAEKLLHIYNNEGLRKHYALAAKSIAQKRFSFDIVQTNFRNVLQSIS